MFTGTLVFSCAAKSAEQLTRGGTYGDSVFLGETQAGRGVRGTADGTYPENWTEQTHYR
jgi:hypothetical protein